MMFTNSKVKDEAWKFLDFIFTTDERTAFDKVEGFLPVNAEEAKNPMFANNRRPEGVRLAAAQGALRPGHPGLGRHRADDVERGPEDLSRPGRHRADAEDAAAKVNATLSKN